ncbi:hypothetical protein GCM10010954_21560 [Halobacillus andaensis]|uniref:Uncharacterized protein n=1 Tax=Halobacillus andaensis TaxID=1176239 RepID=A0A917B606_HALAA|nr:hypothetical protein [Halobacillus andaensis]MBP2004335.1 hypothetical protein [Halobacillus andaensis]GGF22443.1 hypothetical protein GCM10010954_21560 [Halobacillus andaensis]
MKHFYAFESKTEYEQHEAVIEHFKDQLTDYQKYLEQNFALNDLPKAFVWTSKEAATSIFSDLPIPAFTNKDTIYLTPDLSAWKKLFLDQLEDKRNASIEEYYHNLPLNQLLTIAGHELTHHIDLFVDEFEDEREDSIWFEEGMCDYLARKYILSDSEFQEIVEVESQLVEMFKDKYGDHLLDAFGHASYQGSLTGIMFDYWRSFLAVKNLVEGRFEHDVHQLFKEYHKWHREGRKVPLTRFFNMDGGWFF